MKEKNLTDNELKFANTVMKRKRLFFVLSMVSVVVAAGLAAWSVWATSHQAGFDVSIHVVLIILILLNARQNLRQFRYANIIEKLLMQPSKS